MITVKGKYTSAKIMIDSIDESCMSQINTFINHSAFTNPIAIMPDTHAGKGSVIGFTMELTDKVIPNVIGVDIGCGMCSVNIGKNLKLSFDDLDRKIRNAIPFGQNVHSNAMINMKNDFPWHRVNVLAEKFAMAYLNKFEKRIEPPKYSNDWFLEKSTKIGGNIRRYINSIGTLGGGNHFIETGISEKDDYWITVHTGSRNFGKRICEFWQGKAAKIINKAKKETLKFKIQDIRNTQPKEIIQKEITQLKEKYGFSNIDTRDKEWLEGKMASDYLFDMIFAQVYAEVNRQYIVNTICSLLKCTPNESIETIHNFIDFNDFVIRKGAIRSYENELMIIPFNMRDGLLVCEGKSNPEWNFSAPHGAGRVMSRTQAKKNLNVDTFKEQMKEIYSTSVGIGTLDESPDTYKDASLIENAISDTATIIHRIKPLHNMKDAMEFQRRRRRR